jgi:hypothetical protein
MSIRSLPANKIPKAGSYLIIMETGKEIQVRKLNRQRGFTAVS